MEKIYREQISGKEVLVDKSPYFKLVKIYYTDAYGKAREYFAVERPGAVAIAAIIERNKEIILIKQFRPAIDKYVLSLPAGLIDSDKEILQVAKDELLEETGFVAEKWSLLSSNYNSAGILNEQVVLFLATGLSCVGAKNNINEGENIEIIKTPFSDKIIGCIKEVANTYGCVIESSLIAHLAIVKEHLTKAN